MGRRKVDVHSSLPDLDGHKVADWNRGTIQRDDLTPVCPELPSTQGTLRIDGCWVSQKLREVKPHAHFDVMHAWQRVGAVAGHGDGHCGEGMQTGSFVSKQLQTWRSMQQFGAVNSRDFI